MYYMNDIKMLPRRYGCGEEIPSERELRRERAWRSMYRQMRKRTEGMTREERPALLKQASLNARREMGDL